MTERLAIIDSFYSIWGERKKGDQARARFLVFLMLLVGILYMLGMGMLVWEYLSPFFAQPKQVWDSMALGIVFYLFALPLLSFSWYELQLIRHRNRILARPDLSLNNSDNQGLAKFMESHQKVDASPLSLLAIIVGILGTWQIIEPHSYWVYAQFPFWLWQGLSLYFLLKNHRLLNRNIRQVEAGSG